MYVLIIGLNLPRVKTLLNYNEYNAGKSSGNFYQRQFVYSAVLQNGYL